MDAPDQAVFVDTSAWIALTHRRDQAHGRASAEWTRLRRTHRPIVTTDLILAETQALLARRIGSAAALDFARRLLARPDRLVWNDAELTTRALNRLDQFADRPLTLTDAVSFALMEERGIREAFTFDRDFEDAGFTVLPTR